MTFPFGPVVAPTDFPFGTTAATKTWPYGELPFTHGTGGGLVTPAISRTADGSVGQTYTVVGVAAPFNWAWSDGTDISGATSATYVAQTADIGKTLVVEKDGVIVARAAGPVLIAPIVIQSYDSGTFTPSNSPVLSFDTVNKAQGLAALNIGGNGTGSGALFATKTEVNSLDPATFGTMVYRYDAGDDPEYATAGTIQGYVGRSGTYSSLGSLGGLTESVMSPRYFAIAASEVAAVGALGVGQFDTRMAVTHARNRGGNMRVDAFAVRAQGVPSVIFALDDVPATQHSILLPMFQSRGLRGQLYIPTDLVGTAISFTRMTWSQIADMAAAGFEPSPNGTKDDTSMTAHASPAVAVSELQAMQAELSSRGYTAGLNYSVYPNGDRFLPGTKIAAQSTISDGSDILTMASKTGVVNGYRAAGRNITQSPETYVTDDSLSDVSSINFDGQTSNYTVGEVITGSVSLAIATITSITDLGTTGSLALSGITGTFQDNETLTGSLGGSALANGVVMSKRVRVSSNVAEGTQFVDFTDTSGPWHYGKGQAALIAAGMRCMRTAGTAITIPTRFEGGGIGRRFGFINMSISNGVTFAAVQALIDEAILRGTTLCILVHGVVAGAGPDTLLNVNEDKLILIADYVQARMADSGLANPTWSELDARDFNSTWPA